MAGLTIGELRIQIVAEIAELKRDLNAAKAQINSFSKASQKAATSTSKGFTSLLGVVRTLAPALAALSVGLLGAELVSLGDTATTLRNRLRLVTDDAEGLQNAFGALRTVANETRVGFDVTVDLFKRLSIATDDLAISEAELVNLTETVNQTLAISGATGAEASGGLIQFAQGLASGRLSGDELRSVLESLPSLAQSIAKGLGVSVGELRKLGAEGKLTAEAVLGALQDQAPRIATEFAKITPTVSAAFGVIQNEILVVVDALNQSFAATELFAGGILNVGEGLAQNLGGAIDFIIRQIAVLVRTFAQLIDTIENVGITAGNLQETFRLVFDVVNVVIQSIQTGFRSIQVGINALITSLQLVGNALGLVSDAAVAEGLNDFTESQEALIASSLEANAALTRLAAGFVEIDSTAGDGPDNRLSEGVNQLALDIEAGASRVSAAIAKLQGARERLNDDPGTAAGRSPAVLKAQADGLTELEKIQKRINAEVEREEKARLRARSPLLAQVTSIESQIRAIKRLNLSNEDRIKAEETINKLIERRDIIQTRLNAAAAESQFVLADIEQQTVTLGEIDEASGIKFQRKLEDLMAKGLSGEKLQKALEDLQRDVDRAITDAAEDAGPTFSESLTANLADSFETALTDGGFDFLDAFGRALQQTAAEKLSEGFAEATQSLAESLTAVLEDVGSLIADLFRNSSEEGTSGGILGTLGSIGGSIADIFTGGASEGTKKGVEEGGKAGGANFAKVIGPVVGGLIGAALRKETVTSTALLSSAATTAGVTSAQQTRGIVVGPQNIAIADVGRSIQDAFLESERLLGIIANNTSPRSTEAPGSLGASTDEVTTTLANESESLF